jgi:hypothetical protein
MARNRPTNAPVVSIGELEDGVEEPGGLASLPPDSDDLGDETDMVNDVERVCAEVGSSSDAATINVFRVDENRKNPDAFLMTTTPKEFSLTNILFEYGGGKYRIRGYHPREYGGVKMFVNRIVVLEEPKRRINELPAPPVDRSNDIIAAIAEMNRQNQEFMRNMMLMQKPSESRENFLKEMMLIKELFSQPVSHEPPAQNPIGMLKDVMELQANMKAFSGDGEGGGGAMSMLGMKLLEKLGDLATANKAQMQEQPTMIPAVPVQSQLPQISDEEKQMRQMLEALINSAHTNSDVEFWANAIYDQAPESLLDELLENPFWFDKFSKFDARIGPLRSWFEKLRARVVDIHAGERLTENTPDATKTGNTAPDNHVSESKT